MPNKNVSDWEMLYTKNVSNGNLNVGKCSTSKSVCDKNIDFNYTVVKAKLF